MSERNRQQEERVYRYVEEYCEKYQGSPSVDEVAKAIGRSKSTTHKVLKRLEEEKRLTRNEKGNYVKEISGVRKIPLIGEIACGKPIYAEENIESYLPLPKEMFGRGEYYALKAKGDSMIGAGIEDGDIVFVKKQDYAKEGDIIVALIEDEATLKRLKTRKEGIVLHAENERYEDICVEELRIQGVAVKVLKNI